MNWLVKSVLIGIAAAAVVAAPFFFEAFTVLNLTVYFVMAILALSLAFVWGMGGIMCLGQSAFFGLGAYGYAIAAINFGPGTSAILIAIVVPSLFALLLGYFMFYGRVSDIYVGVITLAVTMVLFNLVNSTSGPQYKIGKAPIGGFNGINSIPTLSWPDGSMIDINGLYYVAVGILALCYILIKLYLNTSCGKVAVAIRENEHRASLLGYNVSFNKLMTFTLGGAVAGLAGCLFANWGSFVSPTLFTMAQSGQVVIWVIVGGRGTLIGPILGCVFVQWMMTQLGTQQKLDAGFVLGLLMTLFVLLVPLGLAPMVTKFAKQLLGRQNNETNKQLAISERREA